MHDWIWIIKAVACNHIVVAFYRPQHSTREWFVTRENVFLIHIHCRYKTNASCSSNTCFPRLLLLLFTVPAEPYARKLSDLSFLVPLKTECVGSFPLPVPHTVGLRIAPNHGNGQLQKAHAWIISYDPTTCKVIHIRPTLCATYAYDNPRQGIYNIPTVGIYVATVFRDLVKLRSLQYVKTSAR